MIDEQLKLNARGQPFQPGDVILDRCMPDASDKEREEARQNLYNFAAVILQICERIAAERRREAAAAKGIAGED